MTKIRRVSSLGLLLVLAGLMTSALGGAASGGATQTSGSGPDPALVKKLKDTARGSVELRLKEATKHVGFIQVGLNGDLMPGKSVSAKGKEFLRDYGALLGAGSESTLEEVSSTTDSLGATHVTYQQSYRGVPVWAATIKTHVDAKGNLTAVNGIAVPDLSLDTSPRLDASQAAARAIATVVADPPANESGVAAKLSAGSLRAASTTLYVYRLGLPKGAEGTNQLVYEVEVTNGGSVRDVVFVHANVGKVVNRYSMIHDALSRKLYELSPDTAPIWEEGNPFPGSLNRDQQNLVNFSGQTFWLFFNAFDRNSYDGAGAVMKTVNNDPRINCPNANWNGITTNYCTDVTGDDTVAHEWGHAYTEKTHNLIYQWQPGALNESYSDIWGEVVDLINGVGTDSPGGARRGGVCSSHTTPLPVLAVNSPSGIGDCKAGGASFGPPLDATGVTGDVVLANDGTGPSTTDACEPLTNGTQIAGKIALVDRGTCAFVIKAKNAQNAGANGVVVANNQPGVPFTMSGTDATLTIPSVMISLDNGTLIKGQLSPGPVNVTMKVGASDTDNSYRWLSGEDDRAFGSAIRDMWNPNCLSDPGKVSDAEYQCSTSDGGGVHTNSGVPNHGFALLVDGGTYNGQTVAALGLTKAAHLYWRAQSVYQTKTTDFDDHATALAQSCTDLIGVQLKGLSTTSTTVGLTPPITDRDCDSVTAMIAAVELRKDPTVQCNFTPLLSQNPPTSCATQKNAEKIYEEDFEDGLTGWSTSNQAAAPSGGPKTNWVAASAPLPGGRTGTVAFAPDLDGQCDGGPNDRSGVMRLQSPVINIPGSGIDSAGMVLAFDHNIASEFGVDGGNVKISVNGGPYQLIPAAAYIFNQPNTTMETLAAGNTSPLAGEEGFSGTDGGQVTGTWGQSQIDLRTLKVKKGDKIILRWEFGMDGCGAVDGWYIDNIKLTSCNTHKKLAAGSSQTLAVARKED